MEYIGQCHQMNCMSGAETIMSSSVEIDGIGITGQMRKDLQVQNMALATYWGRICGSNGQPVPGNLVWLVRIYRSEGGYTFTIVDSVDTDAEGRYQFEIQHKEGCSYTVLSAMQKSGDSVLESQECGGLPDAIQEDSVWKTAQPISRRENFYDSPSS